MVLLKAQNELSKLARAGLIIIRVNIGLSAFGFLTEFHFWLSGNDRLFMWYLAAAFCIGIPSFLLQLFFAPAGTLAFGVEGSAAVRHYRRYLLLSWGFVAMVWVLVPLFIGIVELLRGSSITVN